jgi:hypothetical protein
MKTTDRYQLEDLPEKWADLTIDDAEALFNLPLPVGHAKHCAHLHGEPFQWACDCGYVEESENVFTEHELIQVYRKHFDAARTGR